MAGHSLRKELDDYFLSNSRSLPSVSAFVQQRAKLSPDAFPRIFRCFNNRLPFTQTYRGLHLIACDGTDLNIPSIPGDKDPFIPYNSKNGGYSQMHLRTITVPVDCIHLLILWRKEQMQLAWNMGETWKGYYGRDFDKNFIFIQPETGLPMNVSTPTHKFKEILKLYNDTHELEDQLPDISLHELRHTSATLLLANGTDIETVSHRLGHSKASTTLDVYGHAMKKMDSKASDTLESILS